MAEVTPVNISTFIDERPISGLQWRVIALCFVVAMVDGFDTQAIAFVAPVLRDIMSAGPKEVGTLYSAGLIGLMVGALTFGPVADRVGRKPVIILSCLLMSGFSLLTAAASTVNEVLLYRFLTGLGLGAAMPNLNALTAEFSPKRSRAFLMTLMFAGFPAGAILGGLVSVPLIESFGWQSVFVMGGITPLLVAAVLVVALPESLNFRITRNDADPRIPEVLRRMDQNFVAHPSASFTTAEAGVGQRPSRLPMWDLFADGRTMGTLLIWLIYFSNLLMMYSLLAWLPTYISDSGLGLAGGIYTAVAFNGGGVVGGLIMARLIDRQSGYAALFCGYLIATATGFLIGGLGASLWTVLAVLSISGMTLMGGAFAMNAITAIFYPTRIRATGLGWGLAIGRTGAIIGPIGIGAAFAAGWSSTAVFSTISALGLVCAASVLLLRLTTRRLEKHTHTFEVPIRSHNLQRLKYPPQS